MKTAFKRQKKWIRVKEDWYPTIPGNACYPNVEYNNPLPDPAIFVKLILLNDGMWRVCAWGGDDHGLEKDCVTRTEARTIYNLIKDFTTHEEMRSWGMYGA